MYLLNGFINCVQEQFSLYADTLMNYVVEVLNICMEKQEDDFTRCVVGVIADISNYTPDIMTRHIPKFQNSFLQIMQANNFTFDTKIGTIHSLGDILMNATHYPEDFFSKAFSTLNVAMKYTFEGKPEDKEEQKEQLRLLRAAVLGAYFSFVHGIEAWMSNSSLKGNQAVSYCETIIAYVNEIFLNKAMIEDLDTDSINTIYEMYSDCLMQEHCGRLFYEALRSKPLTQNLRSCMVLLKDEEVKTRFQQAVAKV